MPENPFHFDPKDTDATQLQRDFVASLTVQRMANVNALADLLGDMNADGLEIFRIIGGKDYKSLREFLRTTDEKTFKWLARADEDKLKKIDSLIQLAGNGGFMARWTIYGVTIVSTVAGFIYWVYKNVRIGP
jgi:hypothetical protein